jgi:biuret amidohydrolase
LSDACGSGHAEAGKRSMETMKFVGEAMITEVDTFAGLLARG